MTRWDVHKFARQAYDVGVRYIGGCCGFEPYHIRAVAEEVRGTNIAHGPVRSGHNQDLIHSHETSTSFDNFPLHL